VCAVGAGQTDEDGPPTAAQGHDDEDASGRGMVAGLA